MPSNFDELYRAVKREGIKEDNQIDGVSMVGMPQIMNLNGKKKIQSKNPYLRGINSINPSSLTRDEKRQLVISACKGGEQDAQHKVNALLRKGDREVMDVFNEWSFDCWDEYSEMEGSTFIHSKDYEPMNCVICGAHMPTIHHTHNPHPYTSACIAKDALLNHREDRCCSKCDKEIVLPLRMKTGNSNDSAYYKKWKENPNGGGE